MQAIWGGVAAMTMVAVIGGVAEHRRVNRDDPDRVSVVPWPTVQFLAILIAFLLAALAVTG
ncbi:hypothetical protein ACNI3Q_09585 [Sphingomonas sp. FW199]|uniref:hypothetical protein n=1 Tax=unclassified Sphingomonas TaxID=196159 RepID=UPI0021A3ABC5|nr:hypothetical protein [Sphingomonas sp. BGYR3]MDG5489573.1 hypothetical protein [Sphingomonas sp. BGYR3]